MNIERCPICGQPIREARGWKYCGRYGEAKICIKHCADTCKTLFGAHCIYSSTHAPTATSLALFDPFKQSALPK